MNVARAGQVRIWEQQTVSSGTPEYELMLRAGRAAAAIIKKRFPTAKRVVVLCGSGNNGGDGLVVASCFAEKSLVYAAKKIEDLCGAAALAARDLPENVPVFYPESEQDLCFEPGDLVVDALLGIGFSGKLREQMKKMISAVNASGCRCVSLDLPSGLDGNTGIVEDLAVRADLTITFGAVKQGLLCGDGPRFSGIVEGCDIGLDVPAEDPQALTFREAMKYFPVFESDVHKNQKGELLIVAGSKEYSGAASLAAKGALRTGAGIVRLACCSARKSIPDAVIYRELPGSDPQVLDAGVFIRCRDWCERSNALVCGPGLGNAPEQLISDALDFKGPVLLDADALNLISRKPGLWKKHSALLITPHFGEASRLAKAFAVGFSGREDLACKLAEKLSCCVLLKGKNTIVSSPEKKFVYILPGSPALATAGSGDVLSGVIGALLAMGCGVFEAAVAGAALHGAAGEAAGAGMIADDLPLLIGKVLQQYKDGSFL